MVIQERHVFLDHKDYGSRELLFYSTFANCMSSLGLINILVTLVLALLFFALMVVMPLISMTVFYISLVSVFVFSILFFISFSICFGCSTVGFQIWNKFLQPKLKFLYPSIEEALKTPLKQITEIEKEGLEVTVCSIGMGKIKQKVDFDATSPKEYKEAKGVLGFTELIEIPARVIVRKQSQKIDTTFQIIEKEDQFELPEIHSSVVKLVIKSDIELSQRIFQHLNSTTDVLLSDCTAGPNDRFVKYNFE